MHLSQRMALQQVLAPQLQQSLALLQAPMLELNALVEQELQQNPVLEEAPPSEANSERSGSEGEEGEFASNESFGSTDEAGFETPREKPDARSDDFQSEFDQLAQADQDWRESYAQGNAPLRGREEDEERRQFMLDSLVARTSLQEALLEQVRLSELSPADQAVAEIIVGNIDDNGYLKASVDELAFSTNTPRDRVEALLEVVQTFDPPGVAARDLGECLRLQLERAGRMNTLEYRIVRDHMEALGRRRFPEIARALDLSVEVVQAAADRISRLEPRPGREFAHDENRYVLPEVFVHKMNGEYVVTTNNEAMPHLRISNTYKDLMAQSATSAEVRNYIREKIRAGKFLIKSLHQRQQTLLNIGREIVQRQREFMDNGVAHLKPMTMAQIANAVGVHETTVSRAVAGKYIQTPQGVFDLRYFFTAGIPTASGTGLSNQSVKEMISDLVSKEDRSHPLSDEDLVKHLSEHGVLIARRTVAKYRTELGILPSHLRRVY